MIDLKKDETFLARWLNGELTEIDLKEFEKHPDYNFYVKLKQSTEHLPSLAYDVDTHLQRIHDNKERKETKDSKKVFRLFPVLAIAASILIIFGLFFYNPDTTISTGHGQMLTVDLPDGSQVMLNAMSQVVFNKRDWNAQRSLNLIGEAFFKVTNGNTFTVHTKHGDITVLGTQFNVNVEDSFFEVSCYEGKVKVKSATQEKILVKNQIFRSIKNTPQDFSSQLQEKPTWIDNTSSFSSVPLNTVIQELEDQYNIKINNSNLKLDILYTGTFPNDNLDVALRSVFSTLGMNYRLSENKKDVMIEK
ncbi:FecR family protein [Aquimarina intermedia]|uniref:FecR family protein n=1 Tax=Aquimarina intermedia TaxID=350814 RepID=A0A5S5C0C1_9FLAO|nr:FecR family protein [Aquimarina intermedia]TYP72865.1 FecR family protein [Aquimarina intermedia]